MSKRPEDFPQLREILNELSEYAGYLFQRGWAERNAGNITVNLTDCIHDELINHSSTFLLTKTYSSLADKYFYVSATGSRMPALARQPLKHGLIIRINSEGNGYGIYDPDDRNTLRVTSELPTHLAIHHLIAGMNREHNVVIHTHATDLIALTQNAALKNEASINKILWGMHPETRVFVPNGVGFVPYTLPGTEDIAGLTIEALRDHDVALWEKHGVFAIGKTIADTFDTIDLLNKSAMIYLKCLSAGFTPEGLTEDQLKELDSLLENLK